MSGRYWERGSSQRSPPTSRHSFPLHQPHTFSHSEHGGNPNPLPPALENSGPCTTPCATAGRSKFQKWRDVSPSGAAGDGASPSYRDVLLAGAAPVVIPLWRILLRPRRFLVLHAPEPRSRPCWFPRDQRPASSSTPGAHPDARCLFVRDRRWLGARWAPWRCPTGSPWRPRPIPHFRTPQRMRQEKSGVVGLAVRELGARVRNLLLGFRGW